MNKDIKQKKAIQTDTPRAWSDFMQDLTAVDTWIVQRAMEILDKSVIERGPTIRSPQDVKNYLRLQLTSQQREVFGVVFLDSQHRVIAYESLFFGTINETAIYPRAVIQRAMALNAAAVILAHNHPSGTVQPSEADKKLTERLRALLGELDVRLLDHFIVGDEGVFSFTECGLI